MSGDDAEGTDNLRSKSCGRVDDRHVKRQTTPINVAEREIMLRSIW